MRQCRPESRPGAAFGRAIEPILVRGGKLLFGLNIVQGGHYPLLNIVRQGVWSLACKRASIREKSTFALRRRRRHRMRLGTRRSRTGGIAHVFQHLLPFNMPDVVEVKIHRQAEWC